MVLFQKLCSNRPLAFVSIIGLLCLLYGLYAGALILSGNFHEVLPNELYRSAQLRPDKLSEVLKTYGIRTVYNLRGPNPDQPWYRDEKEAVEKAGLNYISIPMKASRVMSDADAHNLMDSFSKAEKPILIHCKSGADRTGLAAALYLAGVAQKGEEASEAQLSLRYGHIALPFLGEFNMDQTFENLESFFNYEGS